MAVRCKSEAAVESAVLRHLGRDPHLLLAKNEVARGFQASLLPALQQALAPFGREVVAAAVAATQRHRAVYGLGVGSPDLVFSASGRAGGLELKRPIGGEVSEEQARWHKAARRRGFFVAVVTSEAEAEAAVARCRAGEVE